MAAAPRHVCVYCSSSAAVDHAHIAVARELGAALAARGDVLVWGGATVGLMGEVARAARARRRSHHRRDPRGAAGGRDRRPRRRRAGRHPGHAHPQGGAGPAWPTPSWRSRAASARSRSCSSSSPAGCSASTTSRSCSPTSTASGSRCSTLFEHLYRERFARPESRDAYAVATDVAGVLAALDATPADLPGKWL